MAAYSKKDQPAFILASASPRRKKLLSLLDIPFHVQPAQITELYDDNDPPDKIVQELALQKAHAVAEETRSAVILGADTLVVHQNKILGKPQSEDHARRILHQLSDSTHHVFTGVALVKTNGNSEVINQETFFESTCVRFGPLDEDAINRYVAGGGPMDKAGAYGIQDEESAVFVKCIKGDYYTIVGLPLHALYHHLKTFAPQLLRS